MRHSNAITIKNLADANQRAVNYFKDGDCRRAAVLFEKTLTGCQDQLGPEHPETLTVAGNLGVALVATQEFDEGINVIERNVADRSRVFGDNHRHTLTALNALAVSYRYARRIPEAVERSRDVALRRAQHFGQADPDTLSSRLALALSLAAADDGQLAAAEITAAVHDAQAALGPEHSHTKALLNHAVTLDR